MNASLPFPRMKRVAQISDAHCGPAVLRMLLSNLGINQTKQSEIVAASGVENRIWVHGVTVWELARAVNRLLPEVNLWYKDHATVDELDVLINQYRIPVGGEWQGVFREYDDGDSGHYGVATYLNQELERIKIADPFSAFAGRDRIFKLPFFLKRWWDTNELTDPGTGQRRYFLDEKMMFVVVPNEVTVPSLFGMIRDEELG